MSNDIAIRVDSVSKSFKLPHEKHSSLKSAFISTFKGRASFEKQEVLDNVSFEIKKGEFFAIVGRNGSGKSTLLKLLAGIYSPDKGAIQVNGKLTPFIELGVGFNPELTGKENVFLNGALLGFSRKEMEAMYDEIVEFAELEKFMDQKLKNYSSGMQVRLAFSIAIRAKSEILLLDEVLAVGDTAFQQKCFDYFETIKKENRTVVFVSHDMGSVTRFCTGAIYIKDGELIQAGSASDIAKLYKMENLEAVNKSVNEAGIHTSSDYHLEARKMSQDKKKLLVGFSYSSKSSDPMYIGISILKEGISIAEITTSLEKPLKGSGRVSYGVDLGQLNEGLYQLTSVICRIEDRRLLSISKESIMFSVDKSDITRGAAMRLEDNWSY